MQKRWQEPEDIYSQMQKQQMGGKELQYFTYKRCSTAEEAFAFARDLGILSPRYVGIDIDLINYIHKGLVEYANNMIRAGKPIVMPTTLKFDLNEILKQEQLHGNQFTYEALNKGKDIIIRPDKTILFQSQASADQRYKSKKASTNNRYHVIYHELGHLAQQRLASFSNPRTRLSANERDYIERNLSIYPGENLVKNINGNYTLKSYILYIQEIFAELVARIASGVQLDITLQNIYDRILNNLP